MFYFKLQASFCSKKKRGGYKLWQPPQGTVENKETPKVSLQREIGEELGKTFAAFRELEFTFFGEGES